MERLYLLIVAALIVAGCTSIPSQGESESQVRGLLIEDASLSDSSIGGEESTELVLRLANTHPVPVEDIWINVSNRGGIQLQPPDNCKKTVEGNCKLDRIDGTRLGASPREIFVWDVQAGGAPEGSYPLTLSLTYNSRVESDKSLKVEVSEEVENRQRRSATLSNSEISFTLDYPVEVESSSESIELGLKLSDIGEGEVVGGQRSVSIGYSGGFAEVIEFGDNKRRCQRLVFGGDGKEVSGRCNLYLQDGVEEGSIYSLRLNAEYRYEKLVEIPLEVEG